ncbi:hypothetical protein T06_11476 [Trichinella sp. T6]|nr:hypothetical protein T06_11476 [Trichinella sp. T6]
MSLMYTRGLRPCLTQGVHVKTDLCGLELLDLPLRAVNDFECVESQNCRSETLRSEEPDWVTALLVYFMVFGIFSSSRAKQPLLQRQLAKEQKTNLYLLMQLFGSCLALFGLSACGTMFPKVLVDIVDTRGS